LGLVGHAITPWAELEPRDDDGEEPQPGKGHGKPIGVQWRERDRERERRGIGCREIGSGERTGFECAHE
jgi:hypothetical protein